MASTAPLSSNLYQFDAKQDGEVVVHTIETMNIDNASSLLKNLRRLVKTKSPSALTIDLNSLAYIDDFGAQVLFELRDLLSAQDRKLHIVNTPPHADDIISRMFFDLDECVIYKRKRSLNILSRLGEAILRYLDNVRFMISFLGSVILAFLHILFHPKSLRANDMLSNMEKTGVDALPIVALISFLLGFIMAFMSSLQLQQFGANLYVASLVGFAMVSELGPIMTAIIVAGRSGSAFAAEIGTMKISEEVDALFVMGFNPALFLAVPKILAALIVVPLLTFFSDLFAILGGLLIGVTMLDLSISSYLKQTIETLTLFEVLWGLMKSAVFGVTIAWIGCLRGFQTRGGAAGVGTAATSAVVTSIFLIILFDSIFAILRSYWG